LGAFGGLILTNKGRNLQAKAQAGTQLNFTKIKIGDGSLSGQSIADLTDLISIKKELNILSLETMTGGKAKLRSYFSNADIETGFYWRELGVFAQDPQEGEILYCYGNAGANAEYIPAGGGPDVVERYINVITLVGDASNISATLGSEIYVTQAEFDSHASRHASAGDDPIAPVDIGAETPAEAQAKADAAAAAGVAAAAAVQADVDEHKAETIQQGAHGGLPAHKSTHASGGTDALTPADVGAVNKAGDTMTGNLTIAPAGNASIELGRTDGVASTPFIDLHSGATAVDYDSRILASGGTGANAGGTLNILAATLQNNGNKVWHAGNDGAGSGLDADLLDGFHAGTAANNVLKLDASGLVPLANIPATLTGKNADQVDGLHVTGSGTPGLRKITVSTAAPSGGVDGDVWLQYA